MTTARFILTESSRTWHGASPQELEPTILDLGDPKHLQFFMVMLGNGEFDDVCIESESVDVTAAVRGVLTGTGGATPAEPDASLRNSRIFRHGYEVLSQSGEAGRFLINPVPRPELFHPDALARYVREFS